MTHPIPTAVPATLRAGDTATWRRTLSDYPASDGWTLAYVLVKPSKQIAFSATADGCSHLVEVATGTTIAWPPGTYTWQERVSQAGKTYTTATGSLNILPSFAAATLGIDARTHAQKTLEALEAWIESRDMGVAEYQIGDKQLKNLSIPDLLLLRDRYRREVRESVGPKKSGRVQLRFG